MNVFDYWYSHDISSVKIEPQVFAPDLVDAIKNLTSEIKKLREEKMQIIELRRLNEP